jgi:hypothetical protein
MRTGNQSLLLSPVESAAARADNAAPPKKPLQLSIRYIREIRGKAVA